MSTQRHQRDPIRHLPKTHQKGSTSRLRCRGDIPRHCLHHTMSNRLSAIQARDRPQYHTNAQGLATPQTRQNRLRPAARAEAIESG